MAMRFEHEFTVPVPVEQAWPVLLDVERVAPCLPGATLDAVEGDAFTGRMKVKVGPVTVTYKGRAAFTSVDKDAHALTLEASGKEARGTGTAGATVDATLAADPDDTERTKVAVRTSFNVTGRPAQFGRGMMAEVGERLIDRFAANLAALLAEAPGEVPAGERETGAVPPLAAEPAATPFNQPVDSPLGTARPDDAAEPLLQVAPPVNGASTVPGELAEQAVSELPAAEAEAPATRPIPGREAAPRPAPAERHLAAVPDDALDPTGREAHPAGTTRTSRTAEEEALDLLRVAGVPMLKRVAPVVAVLAALLAVAWYVRRLLTR
ncbi:SRPBCC family protein [Sphaerisporangium rufum]|nr:SRPBCC family protein [Sphaerisporangium rufum]